jgi:hypothetical protein
MLMSEVKRVGASHLTRAAATAEELAEAMAQIYGLARLEDG